MPRETRSSSVSSVGRSTNFSSKSNSESPEEDCSRSCARELRFDPRKRKKAIPKTDGRYVRCRGAGKGDFDEFFYSTPNSKLLTILIIFTVFLVAMFLYIFKYVTASVTVNDSTNGTIGVYMSIVGLPVGVILSFIVANTWTSFSEAQAKENAEATKLLLLYNLLDAFPGAERIQASIKTYTAFIISDEFPLMEKGQQSLEGLDMITSIGDAIYELDPQTDQETTLYGEAIGMFEEIMALRIARMGYAVYGLAPELWWVLILGVIVVIFMSFFLYMESFTMQAIMTGFSAAILVSLLFLIVALNYPYRGDFGLDSLPFQIALGNMVPDTEEEDCSACPLRRLTRIHRKGRRLEREMAERC